MILISPLMRCFCVAADWLRAWLAQREECADRLAGRVTWSRAAIGSRGTAATCTAHDDRAVCVVHQVVGHAAQDGAPDLAHPPCAHHNHHRALLLRYLTDHLPRLTRGCTQHARQLEHAHTAWKCDVSFMHFTLVINASIWPEIMLYMFLISLNIFHSKIKGLGVA